MVIVKWLLVIFAKENSIDEQRKKYNEEKFKEREAV